MFSHFESIDVGFTFSYIHLNESHDPWQWATLDFFVINCEIWAKARCKRTKFVSFHVKIAIIEENMKQFIDKKKF